MQLKYTKEFMHLIFCLIAFFSLQTKAYTSNINLQITKSSPQSIAISGYIPSNVSYKAFTLQNPSRAVIDFYGTQNKIYINNKSSGIIKNIRVGAPTYNTKRAVLDLYANAYISQSYNKFTHSLQINLQTAATRSQNYPTTVSYPQSYKPNKARNRDIIIVIDPGHGGKDPGAHGPHGSQEKRVVLEMAKKLKYYIDKEPGMRAILTRNSDFYIGLRERLNIARRYNADIFIAIHADAFIHQHSNGASVFALSQRGATSEAARWLAEKENYSELGGVNLAGLDDKNGLIRSVLLDLSQTATISAGLKMGKFVLNSLGRVTHLHNQRVEQARFVVLKSPDIPSILIETGFISNPYEERNLTSPSYQMKLTAAIFYGLKSYFQEYPPHGSKWEQNAH